MQVQHANTKKVYVYDNVNANTKPYIMIMVTQSTTSSALLQADIPHQTKSTEAFFEYKKVINFTLSCVDTSLLHEISPIQNEKSDKAISTTIPIGHTEGNIFVNTLQVARLESQESKVH